MSEAWVANASPLILFSRINRLDLIEQLAPPAILVPNAVIKEVRAGQHKEMLDLPRGRSRVLGCDLLEPGPFGSAKDQAVDDGFVTAK